MHCISRVVYEGSTLECVLDGCTTEEDIEHMFRVAAINGVGRGPFSMPVTFTQKKACKYIHRWQEVFVCLVGIIWKALPCMMIV